MGAPKNRLAEAILFSTHNIGFYEDLTKIIFQLSNMPLISSSVSFSSLSLWSVMKKKPLLTYKNAHHSEGSELSVEENWITAVTALHNTDLIASGKVVNSQLGKTGLLQLLPFIILI